MTPHTLAAIIMIMLMMMLLLLGVFSIVLGQVTVRLYAKQSSLSVPLVVAIRILTSIVLIHVFVCKVYTGSTDDENNDDSVAEFWAPWHRLATLSLGVFLGESFCPVVLTGSIATGKSTVAQMLCTITAATTRNDKKNYDEDDVYFIDADSIGHEILLPPHVLATTDGNEKKSGGSSSSYTVQPSESVYDQICATFPDDKEKFLDANTKQIVRRKLGSVIFSDDAKRLSLNRITHPQIIRILLKRILYGIYVKRVPICCADVPLLFESGMLRLLFCVTIVVATTPELQYQRLRQRNTDLSEEDCRNRIKSQYPMERKVKGADIVVWNNGTVGELKERVKEAKEHIYKRLHGGASLTMLILCLGAPVILLKG